MLIPNKKYPMKSAFLAFLMTFVVVLTLVFLTNCSKEKTYSPKPKGFNRIDLPEAKYKPLPANYPYFFELSEYAIIRKDSSRIAEPFWIHIIYPQFNRAEVQITYKDLAANKNPQKMLSELINDSHTLASKHFQKADGAEESITRNAAGQFAWLLEIGGDVPSQLQFYTTDSTKNFLRGAIYFRTASENDSLAPVIDFIKKDVVHLLNTAKFKLAQNLQKGL